MYMYTQKIGTDLGSLRPNSFKGIQTGKRVYGKNKRMTQKPKKISTSKRMLCWS